MFQFLYKQQQLDPFEGEVRFCLAIISPHCPFCSSCRNTASSKWNGLRENMRRERVGNGLDGDIEKNRVHSNYYCWAQALQRQETQIKGGTYKGFRSGVSRKWRASSWDVKSNGPLFLFLISLWYPDPISLLPFLLCVTNNWMLDAKLLCLWNGSVIAVRSKGPVTVSRSDHWTRHACIILNMLWCSSALFLGLYLLLHWSFLPPSPFFLFACFLWRLACS